MRRSLSALLLVAAAGILATPATAIARTSPAGDAGPQRFGVRLYDIPAADARNPRGQRYIIDYLRSGAVVHRRILVLNYESRPARFAVYADAASITGGMFIGAAGQTRSELTGWITVRHPAVVLGPRSSAADMITIRVPRSAARGEHYGVIWVQQIAHARTAAGIDVLEVARIGVRIYLAVGPGGAPPTRFAITSLTARRSAGGRPVLVAHVRNTGGRAVDLSGRARLSAGPAGMSAGPFPEQQTITLAPGRSHDVIFEAARRLPAGPWLAAVTLVSGFTTRTVEAVVRFPVTVNALGQASLIIWGAGLMTGLLAIALVMIRRTRLARRSRPDIAGPVPCTGGD